MSKAIAFMAKYPRSQPVALEGEDLVLAYKDFPKPTGGRSTTRPTGWKG